MRRCTRCVMPDTVPGIEFGDDGVCSFCRAYRKEEYLGKHELDRIITSAKRCNAKYDCIVPLSGGRDSAFVLYVAKKIYDLRILAVNYDNEFRVHQAYVNMKNACRLLDVDFISVRSKRNAAKHIVLNSIRNALPSGLGAMSVCGACAYGYRSVVYIAADRYEVPLIIWGASQAEDTFDMERKAKESASQSPKVSIVQKLLSASYYKVRFWTLLQRLEFPVKGNRRFSRGAPILKNRNTTEIRLFDYLPWDRKNIKEIIEGELDWKRPSGHVSTWRIDCELHSFVNHQYFSLLGCSKDCFGYCNMINSGTMSRSEALEQEEEMALSCARSTPQLLERIGLSKREVREVVETLSSRSP